MPVRGGGFIQGYNAQNVTSTDGLIIATELTADTTDMAWFAPMLTAALRRRRPDQGAPAPARRCGPRPRHPDRAVPRRRRVLLGHNLALPGPDRLIATGKHRDLEKRARASGTPDPGPRGRAVAAMAARLATGEGITAYRQRGHIAETPHGHIKHNMRFRQLTMRGKAKAAAEWRFTCTAANLAKAITSGRLTLAALASLATHPA